MQLQHNHFPPFQGRMAYPDTLVDLVDEEASDPVKRVLQGVLRAHSCKNSGGYGPEADDWGFVLSRSPSEGRDGSGCAFARQPVDRDVQRTAYSIDHKGHNSTRKMAQKRLE
jgi:hypothetical protein